MYFECFSENVGEDNAEENIAENPTGSVTWEKEKDFLIGGCLEVIWEPADEEKERNWRVHNRAHGNGHHFEGDFCDLFV